MTFIKSPPSLIGGAHFRPILADLISFKLTLIGLRTAMTILDNKRAGQKHFLKRAFPACTPEKGRQRERERDIDRERERQIDR